MSWMPSNDPILGDPKYFEAEQSWHALLEGRDLYGVAGPAGEAR